MALVRTPLAHPLKVGDNAIVAPAPEKTSRPVPSGDDDPVLVSVAAYSQDAASYAAAHARKWADRAERFASSLPVPSRILDVGCGPGRDLARFIAYGHDARGVDLNPDFVEMASAYGPAFRMDLREIGRRFPAGSFDGIWAMASLVHLSRAEAATVLGHFARLLRPGGGLYACVHGTGETGWWDEPDGRRWYTVWEPGAFAAKVEAAGFRIDELNVEVMVEVWASALQGEEAEGPTG